MDMGLSAPGQISTMTATWIFSSLMIVVSSLMEPTHTKIFRNDGGASGTDWTFTEVSQEVGADHCHSGMGLATGDYNRDGWMDYYYTNIGEQTLLLENNQGTFTDKTEAAGVLAKDQGNIELWTWGANFL